MISRTLAAALIISILGAVSPLARAADEPATLLKKQLDEMKAIQAIENDRSKATGDVQQQIWGIGSQLNSLRTPPTDQQLADLKKQLASLQQQVESLQGQIAIASIKDPAEKEAKTKELQTKSEALQKQLNDISAPFNTKVEEARKTYQAANTDFATVLEKFMKDPDAGPVAGAKHDKPSWGSNGIGSLFWKDPAGKQSLWISVFLQPQAYAANTSEKKIDGKYAYSPPSKSNIWLHIGYFNLSVNVNNTDWQGDEAKLIDLVKSVLDLEAIANLKPE